MLTQSDKGRGQNVDEDGAVVAEGDVLSTRGAPMNQGHLRPIDAARQIEALHQDVKLTHIFQPAELVEGQARGTALPEGHLRSLLLLHRPRLLLLNATITTVIVVVVQGQCRFANTLGPEDHPVVLLHHLKRYREGVGGGLILVVTDRDPMHILNTLAHVPPEDADGTPRRHHQASRHHLHQDTGQGDGRVRQVNDRGPSQGTVMAGEVEEAKDTDDHPHLIHNMMEEVHELMLSRTVLPKTTVV